MKRTQFRNVWLMVIAALLVGAWYMFQQAEDERLRIVRAQNRLKALKQERINAQNLSSALAELDQLTLDEATATRLEILRHLGLETTTYDFSIRGRETRQIRGTSVQIRRVQLRADLPYAQALRLVDELHANRKILLQTVSLEESKGRKIFTPDQITLKVEGLLYGLDKKQ